MGVELLTERHKDKIAGILSCYDRIIIQGRVPGWCYASGMTEYFYKQRIRIFDYPKWAEPLRDGLRENMERIAAENGMKIEFVRSKKSFRKEDRVKAVLKERGEHPGVHHRAVWCRGVRARRRSGWYCAGWPRGCRRAVVGDDAMGVLRHFGGRQSHGLRTSYLSGEVVGKARALALMDSDPAPKIREREVRRPVAAVEGPQEREERGVCAYA